jgi:hypothetical protein
VEALWGVCPTRLVILRSHAIPTDAHLLASLRAIPRPLAIVTIETSALARELMASLARQAGATAFHLDGFGYPCLIGGHLIRNLGEHIAAIGAWLRGGHRAPGCGHAPDQGWSRLWRRFSTDPVPARRAAVRSRRVVA